MIDVPNKSGILTENQLFGCGDEQAPPPAKKYTACTRFGCGCSAMDEFTGECLSGVCIFDLQECALEAM